MTNLLDLAATVLALKTIDGAKLPAIKKGFLPPTPDACIGLFEYAAAPPEHSFGGTDIIQGLQVRSRALDAATAHQNAQACAKALNRYQDNEISILQSTAVLDIGRDNANPARQEYTVNFTVRRLK